MSNADPKATETTTPAARAAYPTWTARYSGEDFDRAQALADLLTAEDRAAGRVVPTVGYSRARFDEADKIVSDANAYSAASLAKR